MFPRKRIELFRYSGCLRNAITVVCALEHREIHNVLSVRRVTADEDPHLQDGIFERFSDRVPESVREWKTFRVSSLSSAAEQRRLFAMHFVLRSSGNSSRYKWKTVTGTRGRGRSRKWRGRVKESAPWMSMQMGDNEMRSELEPKCEV